MASDLTPGSSPTGRGEPDPASPCAALAAFALPSQGADARAVRREARDERAERQRPNGRAAEGRERSGAEDDTNVTRRRRPPLAAWAGRVAPRRPRTRYQG